MTAYIRPAGDGNIPDEAHLRDEEAWVWSFLDGADSPWFDRYQHWLDRHGIHLDARDLLGVVTYPELRLVVTHGHTTGVREHQLESLPLPLPGVWFAEGGLVTAAAPRRTCMYRYDDVGTVTRP